MALREPIADLREVHLPAAQMSDIAAAGNLSGFVVSPVRGRLVAVWVNPHTVIDAETTFDVLKNNADTASDAAAAVDVTLPNATADETGARLTPDAVVHVEPGDTLQLQSNGEQAAATAMDVTFIILP